MSQPTLSYLKNRTFQTHHRKFNLALIQMLVQKSTKENLEKADDLIARAKLESPDASLICLPASFNCPPGLAHLREHAETIPKGSTSQMLSKAAKRHSVYLVAGTIPEVEDSKFYHTCSVWDPNGQMFTKYRKLHLLDNEAPRGFNRNARSEFTPGKYPCVFDFRGVRVGLGICCDLRFEELAKLYRINGCQLLVYPAAFNLTTGPLHWEVLQRGRAVDNQVFVCGVSPARGDAGSVAWGHSMVTNPWGKVIAKAECGEEIVHCEVDLVECDKVRRQIPVFTSRRLDIYDTVLNSNDGVEKRENVDRIEACDM